MIFATKECMGSYRHVFFFYLDTSHAEIVIYFYLLLMFLVTVAS